MIYKLDDNSKAKDLFNDWQDTMVLSCLQNVMGSIYTQDRSEPQSAIAILGAFCFVTGRPLKELVLFKPESFIGDFIIFTPQNKEWEKLIMDCYQDKAKKITRYAMKKEKDVFNKEQLKQAVDNLGSEYTLRMIDEPIYNLCKENDWSYDFVSLYTDYKHFENLGLGVVIMKEDELVSGASSYSRYNGGIEVEIDTKYEYRKKGLAYASASKLILECLDRGLYPSWDAQNKISAALAEKLGYHFSHEYTAIEVVGY